MTKLRAFTLLEIIIVVGIVGTLVAIIGTVIASSVKKRGVVTQISEQLRQVNDAIHLYMADYDDHFPPTLEAVHAVIPSSPLAPPPGTSKKFPECGLQQDFYFYARNIDILNGEKRYNVHYPFNIDVNAFLKESGVCRIDDQKSPQMFLENGVHPIYRMRNQSQILGVRFDGSIGWFPVPETWEAEYAYLAHKP